MTRTVAEGFEEFLSRLVPLQSQRDASARHRGSVEASLRNALDVKLFREIGSFGHGTGIRGHYDVDLLVSLGDRPGSSDTALSRVRTALSASFPYTEVRVSRPAVVVDFANGAERWEVTPGYRTSSGDYAVYDIPGAASGWIATAPVEHLKYVNSVNQMASIAGGAKKLARLAKAWKYYNNVPISSFYLEMRAAKWLSAERAFVPYIDICKFMEHLRDAHLAALNDPSDLSGRIYPCSTTSKADDALSKVTTAASRARKALSAFHNSDPVTAFYYYDLLFGGHFPAR